MPAGRHVLSRPALCSRSRLLVTCHFVVCPLVSHRSVWVGALERVGSGSRMYDDGKSGRCRFVGDRTCSIFIDHVAVSDLRSVFTIPPNLPIRLHHTPRVTCIPPRVTLPCSRAPLLSSNSFTQMRPCPPVARRGICAKILRREKLLRSTSL